MFKVRQIVLVVLLLAQGIFEALKEAGDFTQLEEKLQSLTQRAAGMLLAFALEEADRRLLARKDQALKVVGSRDRTLVTSVGELRIRRRMYRDKSGQYIFLLDQSLGLEPHRRISKRMQDLALELSTEMPFRRAAKVLGYLVPSVSPMGVWNAVKAAGEEARASADKLKKDVFARGKVPEGERIVNKLCIEADEVWVRQQRGQSKGLGLKLVVGYEGKQGRPRRRLEHRLSVAGVSDGPGIWEEASCVFGQKWSLFDVAQVRIGGDGAPWIKQGLGYFPGASYHLDQFHLRKRLTEALGSTESYEAVTKGIADLDREAVLRTLDRAMLPLRGARKKRVKDLKSYLVDNWSGIAQLPEEERLGAIEGQVRHTITRRMKRIGARWTLKGADRMSRLLAAKANGELCRYTGKSESTLAKLFEEESSLEKVTNCCQEDVGSWLRATMPALYGPFASRPWVKYVLKEITSIQWPA